MCVRPQPAPTPRPASLKRPAGSSALLQSLASLRQTALSCSVVVPAGVVRRGGSSARLGCAAAVPHSPLPRCVDEGRSPTDYMVACARDATAANQATQGRVAALAQLAGALREEALAAETQLLRAQPP